MLDEIPNSVRYVKNGRAGRWWPIAKAEVQIHAGWSKIPTHMLEDPGDFSDIGRALTEVYRRTGGALRNDLTQLGHLLNNPSKHLWVTFEDGYLWWCIAKDGITSNPDPNDGARGHFWLTCKRPWSNRTLKDRSLARADLPGIVDRVAGFRGTVCRPREEDAILRLIRGEVNPLAAEADHARRVYEDSVSKMIAELKWPDFEQLVDLICGERDGPGSQKGVDIRKGLTLRWRT